MWLNLKEVLLFVTLRRTNRASIQQTTSTLKNVKACQIPNTVSMTAKNAVVPRGKLYRSAKLTGWRSLRPATLGGWREWNGNRSGWVLSLTASLFQQSVIKDKKRKRGHTLTAMLAMGSSNISVEKNLLRHCDWLSGVCRTFKIASFPQIFEMSISFEKYIHLNNKSTF